MTKNGCNSNNKGTTFMCVLVVFMLMVQGGSARLYTCWGGCLNECFLLSSKQLGQRFPCYVNCLAKCFYLPGVGTTPPAGTSPPSNQSPASSPSESSLEADSEEYAADSDVIDAKYATKESRTDKRNYCVMECSLQTCGLHNLEEIVMKQCLIGCINKCKDLNI